MDRNAIGPRIRVKTTELREKLKLIMGLKDEKTHTKARAEKVYGTVMHAVPGHGGDVWFVRHDGTGDIAVYAFDEMEQI